jgi:hypothetical protein
VRSVILSATFLCSLSASSASCRQPCVCI